METIIIFSLGVVATSVIAFFIIRDKIKDTNNAIQSIGLKIDYTNQSIGTALKQRYNIIRDYRSIDELVRCYEALTKNYITEIILGSEGYTLRLYKLDKLILSVEEPNKLNRVLEEALIKLTI
jgi:hypothetical protein